MAFIYRFKSHRTLIKIKKSPFYVIYLCINMSEKPKCYHCQDECVEEHHLDDKVFCCSGCQTVYEILNLNDMSSYYKLEELAGIKPNDVQKGKYDFLDLDDIQEKLLDFKEDSISKVRFFLPQIHCSSCLWLLERLHKVEKGVIQSQVNFGKKEILISFNHEEISLKRLAEILATLGYPPNITLNEYAEDGAKKNNRQLIIKIGVAGFCFGNIMLLSFPEYLGINESDSNFQTLFAYLNLILSIPVLIYSARGYIVSAFKSISAKAINIDVPITMGIFALFSRSLFEVISGSGAGYFDSFAGLIFFLLVGRWFQQKTYDAINFERDYKSFFPIAVTKVVDNEHRITPLQEIEIGDRLIIRNHELIPADAQLVKGKARIDYSFVSGESRQLKKEIGEKIFAGGRQEGSSIEVVVNKNVDNGYLTSLWNNPAFTKQKERLRLSDHIAKYFTIAIILIAFAGGIYWSTADPSKIAFVVTSVLIVACPCAIALSVPFTYGNGIRIMGRHSFYLKSSEIIEAMTEITDVVFDKTGTITQNDRSDLAWEGEELTESQKKIISNIVRHSNHPLSKEIAKNLGDLPDLGLEITEIDGKGLKALSNNIEWKVGQHRFVGAEVKDMQTRVYIAEGEKVLGSFRFSNYYLDGIDGLFNELGQNYRLHILSGDNEAERGVLQEMLPSNSELRFNQAPMDKLDYVSSLQEKGKRVMMIGDGLNDAGALKQSDVGISAVNDLHSFSPSSDGIITTNKIKQIPQFMNFAKYNRNVVMISYVFSLIYNIIGLIFALKGILTPLVAAILMPVSSISVVILVTVLVNMRAKRLGE